MLSIRAGPSAGRSDLYEIKTTKPPKVKKVPPPKYNDPELEELRLKIEKAKHECFEQTAERCEIAWDVAEHAVMALAKLDKANKRSYEAWFGKRRDS